MNVFKVSIKPLANAFSSSVSSLVIGVKLFGGVVVGVVVFVNGGLLVDVDAVVDGVVVLPVVVGVVDVVV